MQSGCYGRLESIIPPITVPAWMCLSTSQDPGSLGVYGFRNRRDHSYENLAFVNSTSIQAPAIWDQIGLAGKIAHIFGRAPFLSAAQSQRHLRRLLPDTRSAAERIHFSGIHQERDSSLGR
jgi:predicted AlkP superfamily phosphohydrolase/phosphomutase